MSPPRSEIETAIQELDPLLFSSVYLIDRVPFAFEGKLLSYRRWKIDLANQIEVDPNAICVNGSASLGISLNPAKHPKDFDESSDLDVAAVSNYHFELAWTFLRDQSKLAAANLSPLAKASVADHKKRLLFNGIIDTRAILPYLPFGLQWELALNKMSNKWPSNGRDVRIRLYRDHSALTAAIVSSVTSLRSLLLEK